MRVYVFRGDHPGHSKPSAVIVVVVGDRSSSVWSTVILVARWSSGVKGFPPGDIVVQLAEATVHPIVLAAVSSGAPDRGTPTDWATGLRGLWVVIRGQSTPLLLGIEGVAVCNDTACSWAGVSRRGSRGFVVRSAVVPSALFARREAEGSLDDGEARPGRRRASRANWAGVSGRRRHPAALVRTFSRGGVVGWSGLARCRGCYGVRPLAAVVLS